MTRFGEILFIYHDLKKYQVIIQGLFSNLTLQCYKAFRAVKKDSILPPTYFIKLVTIVELNGHNWFITWASVTRKNSPNVYKSCPKMISQEK